MRAVLQRVTRARVTVGDRVTGSIPHGLVVLVGIEAGDGPDDLTFVAGKIRDLRIFADDANRMNASVVDVGGSILVVSQFTLLGDCRKGRRPSFDGAAAPQEAHALYEALVGRLREEGLQVATGEFQAMMQVELVNDGPVTLILDSRRRL